MISLLTLSTYIGYINLILSTLLVLFNLYVIKENIVQFYKKCIPPKVFTVFSVILFTGLISGFLYSYLNTEWIFFSDITDNIVSEDGAYTSTTDLLWSISEFLMLNSMISLQIVCYYFILIYKQNIKMYKYFKLSNLHNIIEKLND